MGDLEDEFFGEADGADQVVEGEAVEIGESDIGVSGLEAAVE